MLTDWGTWCKVTMRWQRRLAQIFCVFTNRQDLSTEEKRNNIAKIILKLKLHRQNVGGHQEVFKVSIPDSFHAKILKKHKLLRPQFWNIKKKRTIKLELRRTMIFYKESWSQVVQPGEFDTYHCRNSKMNHYFQWTMESLKKSSNC
jgi:hypothetical protein